MDNGERPWINVRTTDAADLWLFKVAKECVRSGVRFNGRKVGKEQIVNAILSVAMKNEPAAFVEQINSGLESFRKHLEEMGVDEGDEQIIVKVPSPEEARQCKRSRSSSSR